MREFLGIRDISSTTRMNSMMESREAFISMAIPTNPDIVIIDIAEK